MPELTSSPRPALPPLQASDNVLDWTLENLYREGDEVRGAALSAGGGRGASSD